MKVVVFGGTGLVGREVARRWEDDEVISLSSKDADIGDMQKVKDILYQYRPDVVVNCAAIANPDLCEENPELAYRVNAIGARNIAVACQELGCKNVYLSTDHIFDGQKGTAYTEFDEPSPINHYGRSKLAGERYTAQLCSRHFIVRTSILFGVHRDTLVNRCLKQAASGQPVEVPGDQRVSPTYIKDLVLMIRELAAGTEYGIHHVTNHGDCSRYDMAVETLRIAGYPKEQVIAIPSDFTGKALRPLNVVLRNYVGELTGKRKPRPWKEALEEFMRNELNY